MRSNVACPGDLVPLFSGRSTALKDLSHLTISPDPLSCYCLCHLIQVDKVDILTRSLKPIKAGRTEKLLNDGWQNSQKMHREDTWSVTVRFLIIYLYDT